MKQNFRPISFLAAASKLLESIVYEQLYKHLERFSLLPISQHGFRKNHSTFTAITTIFSHWLEQKEKGKSTGILCFDLSSAFDLLQPELFCSKLHIMGGSLQAVHWFKSYLSDRKQRVKVGSTYSDTICTNLGSPQGGLLSPLIFIIFISDLEDWLHFSKPLTYADDTSIACSGDDAEVKNMLELDAANVLSFMASNGLVANADMHCV